MVGIGTAGESSPDQVESSFRRSAEGRRKTLAASWWWILWGLLVCEDNGMNSDEYETMQI